MNNSDSKEEIDLLTLQIFSSILFIITTIVSIVIVYNELSNLKYNKRLISTELSTKIVNKLIIHVDYLLLITSSKVWYINYAKTSERREI